MFTDLAYLAREEKVLQRNVEYLITPSEKTIDRLNDAVWTLTQYLPMPMPKIKGIPVIPLPVITEPKTSSSKQNA